MNPVLIDGNNLAKRCIMATAKDDLKHMDQCTGGVYRALRSVLSVVRALTIHNIGSVYAFWDCGIPAFRMKLAPEYKANRAAKSHMLSDEEKERAFQQMPLIQRAFFHLGINNIKFQEREADDGIGAACRVALADGKRPIIVSGDFDFFQWVRYGASVYDLTHRLQGERVGDLIDSRSFTDMLGVDQNVYLLYKAICGDSSDNLAGVKGVGAKYASSLVDRLTDTSGSAIDQAKRLAALLEEIEPKARKRFEEKYLDGLDDLIRQIKVIDLYASFGSIASVQNAMKRVVTYNRTGFEAFCRKLGFRSMAMQELEFRAVFARLTE